MAEYNSSIGDRTSASGETLECMCPLHVQAEHAQAELSGQLRQAQRQLQDAEGKLQASQASLAFVAAEKKALSRQCSELEHRLNRLQQVIQFPLLHMHTTTSAFLPCPKACLQNRGRFHVHMHVQVCDQVKCRLGRMHTLRWRCSTPKHDHVGSTVLYIAISLDNTHMNALWRAGKPCAACAS